MLVFQLVEFTSRHYDSLIVTHNLEDMHSLDKYEMKRVHL